MIVRIVATGRGWRAGVHKTTIYRRWGSKERLVAEALEEAAESRIGAPDIGDVEGDLRALARAVRDTLSGREGVAAVHALVSGARVSPEVGRIARRFWAPRGWTMSDRSSSAQSSVGNSGEGRGLPM